MSHNTDWALRMASGGRPWAPGPHSSAAVFSADGKHAVVLLSHQLRVYFLQTRQCVRTIDVDASSAVDMKMDPASDSHVILVAPDAVLVVNWRERASGPVPKEPLLVKAHALLAANEESFTVLAADGIYRISRDDMAATQLLAVDPFLKWAVSPNCNNLALLTGHTIVLVDLQALEKPQKDLSESEKPTETLTLTKSGIASLAVSNDAVVAVGLVSGVIQIHYGRVAGQRPHRMLKWHIDSVCSMSFTPDLRYLLLGGLEKVLVFWQLDTDKTQFLPRLNGVVESLSVGRGDLVCATLRVADDLHEILVVLAVDLISRLAVNGPRPQLANEVKSTTDRQAEKYATAPFDLAKVKHDYLAVFEVHPKTSHLYFPHGAAIQAYDAIRNEQMFVQNAAPLLATGKVRSETRLLDPVVLQVAFTHDGEWMCTFDSVSASEVDNLLSKNDKQYALKFWKHVDVPGAPWELLTKIMDPHGAGAPIVAIRPAPESYLNGLGFLTADSKGGLRMWRPRIPKEMYEAAGKVAQLTGRKQTTPVKPQQTAWTLRKVRPSGAQALEAVDVAFLDDGSIIVLGHGCSIHTFSSATFEEASFQIPAICGSQVRAVALVDTHLVVLLKTRLSLFNLLTGELLPLVAQIHTTAGGRNMMAVSGGLVCVATNYYVQKGSLLEVNARVLVFRPDRLEPVFAGTHPQAIAAVRPYQRAFAFVDADSRVGVISSATAAITAVEEPDLARDMNAMLAAAQAAADVVSSRGRVLVRHSKNTKDVDMDLERTTVVDVNTFVPVFENTEGVQLDTLFERIIKIVK